VFWALLLSSKHSGVPEDSKSPTLEVLGFTRTLGQSGVATKPIQDFPYFFMPSFIGLNLLCVVFWERRFFLITNYEFLITFPYQESHNPKFPHLEIVLV
jgi:hypothetical protein